MKSSIVDSGRKTNSYEASFNQQNNKLNIEEYQRDNFQFFYANSKQAFIMRNVSQLCAIGIFLIVNIYVNRIFDISDIRFLTFYSTYYQLMLVFKIVQLPIFYALRINPMCTIARFILVLNIQFQFFADLIFKSYLADGNFLKYKFLNYVVQLDLIVNLLKILTIASTKLTVCFNLPSDQQ